MKRQRDEDIVEILSDSDGEFDSGSEIEIVDVNSGPVSKRVREEDLDYEEPESSGFQFVAQHDAAEIDSESEYNDSEPEYNNGEVPEDSESEYFDMVSTSNRSLQRPSSNGAPVEDAEEEQHEELEEVEHNGGNYESPNIGEEKESNIQPEEEQPIDASSTNSPVETNANNDDENNNTNNTQPKPPAAASTTSTGSNATPSPPVENRSLNLTLVSIVPQQEYRKQVQWLSRVPFYRLTSDFKEPVVIVYNGELLKPYFVADKVAPGASGMDIILLTKRQYQDVLLSEDPPGKFASIISGKEEKDEEKNDGEKEEVEDDAFPIKLEGTQGSVRVMVTPRTQCKQLCDHYMKVKNISSAKIKFEGDLMGPDDTVGDMDLEADDMLDIIS